MNVRLNSRVMLFVCLGLGWSGEGWGGCIAPGICSCYFDCDGDGYFGETPKPITLAYNESCEQHIHEESSNQSGCGPEDTSITRKASDDPDESERGDCDDTYVTPDETPASPHPGAATYPGATELCDGINNDCDTDGKIDEGASPNASYCKDEDDDGYHVSPCVDLCHSDSTQDYSSYKATLDSSLNGGDDCDDDSVTGAKFHPDATENVLDGNDFNCDGKCKYYIDKDGDGIADNSGECEKRITSKGGTCANADSDYPRSSSTAKTCEWVTGASSGFVYMGNICSSDTNPACAQPFDCDPTDNNVYPGKASETCETSPDPPVDEDCDGSEHTYLDSTGAVQSSTGSLAYYADKDSDTFGDSADSTNLCYPDTSGSTVYVSDKTDCNDNEARIYPGALEVCNASYGDDRDDEDCNGLSDEVRKVYGLTEAEIDAAGCSVAYVDADKDGDGDLSGSKPSVCVCESKLPSLGDPSGANPSSDWRSLEDCKQFYGEYSEFCVTMDYCVYPDGEDCCAHPFNSEDESCTSLVENKEVKELRDVLGVTGNGYVLLSSTNQDCNDTDPLIRYSYNTPELLDGRDSDCTGYMPAVEFDCDGDSHIVGLYNTPLLSADECELSDVRDLNCLGQTIRMECKSQQISPTEVVPQWQIRLSDVPSFVDALATKRTPTISGGSDCDDTCASRFPGNEESCDGLDNNCTLARPDDCMLQQALHGECAGIVCEDEADPDGDGAISCNPDAKMVCAREVQTNLQCDGTAEVFRGDPKAYCTRATPYKNSDDPNASGMGVDARCDGVDAAPNGLPYDGEKDDDRDGHYACGPQHSVDGDELGGPESVFVLMYFADDKGYPDNVNAVPLLYPRAAPGGGVLPSDVTLARRLLEDLDKLDWPTSGEAADPLRPITHGQHVVGDPFSGAVDGLQGAAPYSKADPLLELCVRAEICATQISGIALEWCATGPMDDGLSGRCAVVEMKLSEARGLVFDPPDATDSGEVVGADSPSDSGTADVFVGAPIAGELAGRLVWPQARIIESRRRVVEWDCFLTFGTYGCGALTQPADLTTRLERFRPSTLGAKRIYSAPLDAAMSDTRWWKELGRYVDGTDDSEVAVVVTETILSCWGNPTVEEDLTVSVHDRVGGDCRDGDGRDTPRTHRDALEGPDDVLGLLTGEKVDCDTCEDGLDNNCDGLTDCEDPGCAPCWVGQGGSSGGCAGADPEAPCGSSGGCSAGRGVRSPWPSLGELGLLLLAALGLPLYRRGVK